MGKTLYILQSQKNGRYYVGSTDNFQRRFTEHNGGQTKSTRNGIPWIAVFNFEFQNSTHGLKAERRIKSLKSKKIIQGLINHTIAISDLVE
ncbi:MAG: GIY-YIG nuclease family protein [Bacteroidales bacterium]